MTGGASRTMLRVLRRLDEAKDPLPLQQFAQDRTIKALEKNGYIEQVGSVCETDGQWWLTWKITETGRGFYSLATMQL